MVLYVTTYQGKHTAHKKRYIGFPTNRKWS